MPKLPVNPPRIGVTAADPCAGRVVYAPIKSVWIGGITLAATIGGAATVSWQTIALFLATTAAVLLLGHSLGMHRKLIHDSYACSLWLEYFLVYCGALVGLAGPYGMIRTHDMRDWAQRQGKCHDYFAHRRPFLVDAWWQMHCELKLDHPPVLRMEPRIAGDRFYRFIERTWMLQQLPWALLLYWWGGWGFVFWGACARVAACVTGHWLVGYFAHNSGSRSHHVEGAGVQGYNVRVAGLISMGEAWHNNHHAFPGSARIGLYPGEVDAGWWLLKALEACGLVWNLKLPGDLPHRPELKPLLPAQNRPAADTPGLAKDGSKAGDRLARCDPIPRKSWTAAAYVMLYLLPFTALYLLAAAIMFDSWGVFFAIAYGAPLSALWVAVLSYPCFHRGVAPFDLRGLRGRMLVGLLGGGLALDLLSLAAPLLFHDSGLAGFLLLIGVVGIPAVLFTFGVLLKVWKESDSAVFAPP